MGCVSGLLAALEMKKMRERQKLQKQQKEQQLKMEREMRSQQVMEVGVRVRPCVSMS